jgi:hypothetical protein
MSGKMVYSTVLNGAQMYDVSALSKGIYVVQVNSNTQKLMVK